MFIRSRPGALAGHDAGEITEGTRIRASIPAVKAVPGRPVPPPRWPAIWGRPTRRRARPRRAAWPPGRPHERELLGTCAPGGRLRTATQCHPGDNVMLKSLPPQQRRKKNKPELAGKHKLRHLSGHRDAFGTAHRAEGTTYGIAKQPHSLIACAAGPICWPLNGISGSKPASPAAPTDAIAAGSKVSAKLTIRRDLVQQSRWPPFIVWRQLTPSMPACGLEHPARSLDQPDLV